MSEAPAAPELLYDGRFHVTGMLGRGAQADTLAAIDKRDGVAVALKRFHVRNAQSWKDVELAEREAKVLAGLSHPLLPRYLAHFEQDGALYLAMQRVDGPTLHELREGGSLAQSDVLAFLWDAADTLDYLHGRSPPIVHRDIKPRNVIRNAQGRYVLVDFGSVQDRLRPDGGSTVVGTFGYMAPEQFQGRAAPCSDTYAAAATALSLLTRNDPERLPHRGLGIDVKRALNASTDTRLEAVLTAALEWNPELREKRSLSGLLRAAGLTRQAQLKLGHAQSSASATAQGAANASSKSKERRSSEHTAAAQQSPKYVAAFKAAKRRERQLARQVRREHEIVDGAAIADQLRQASRRMTEAHREVQREVRDATREAHQKASEAHREAREAYRDAKREARRHAQRQPHGERSLQARAALAELPRHMVPQVFVSLAWTLLNLVRLILAVGLGVMLPTLLSMLAPFFGAPLRRAAADVRQASRDAQRELGNVQRAFRDWRDDGVITTTGEAVPPPRIEAPVKRPKPD